MRHLFFFLLGLGTLGLAGCDTADNSSLSLPFSGGGTHVQVFNADQRKTYEAMRTALKQMEYRVTRGGPAEGRLEAMSGISPDNDLSSAHQFHLKAEFGPAENGTEVSVAITEIIEDKSDIHPGIATETPVRDTPLYDVFFHAVQEALSFPTPKP